MNKLSLIFVLALLPLSLHAWQADMGDGTFKNPVLFSDYSDPDVIRVESSFYMVSSSFHYMPGIPILVSKDLVNWKIIGHAFPRLEIDPAYNLSGGNRYGGGCWAPAIRYHNNRFYIYFPTPKEGIFMTSATAPEGPWSPLVCVIAQAGLEDPCPFWDDDGSAYLIHSMKGAGPLILHKMSPDGKSVLDAGKLIVKDGKNLPVLEGPKLYKRNGFYYIFAPFGGVGGGSEVVLRAKNIFGPYDYKRVLSQGSTNVNGPHQGGYIDTPSGQGWFFHFHSQGAAGRIDYLEPVTWQDDWPVIGEKAAVWAPKQPDSQAVIGQGISGPVGQPVLVCKKPDVPPAVIQIPQTSDEFDQPSLGLQWEWNHNPDDAHWSLTERPGFLRLTAGHAADLLTARNTLTQMLCDPDLAATTLLDLKGMRDGQKAGLCAFCSKPSGIEVDVTGGHRHIVAFTLKGEIIGPEFSQDTIQLKMEISAAETVVYFYSLDGKVFTRLGPESKLNFSWWKGARLGLFSYNKMPNADGGIADFDWFHYVAGH